jgi:hypothetical protein
MRSIQYYLLDRDSLEGIGPKEQLFKTSRLSVLLYVSVIQNEFWASPISNRLIWQLKSCLQSENFTTDPLRAFRLWVLFLAGSLIFDSTEKVWFIESVVEAISQLSLWGWGDALLLFKTFVRVREV